MIGDQLETDILAANKAKISSVLVTTGVKNIDMKNAKPIFEGFTENWISFPGTVARRQLTINNDF